MSSIARKPHRLLREKTLAMPRHVILFDTETNQKTLPDGSFEHMLKLGWACYLRKPDSIHKEQQDWLEFTDPESFWSFVLSRCKTKNRLWVIAHNIGFDFTVVKGFEHLGKAGFKCKFFYSRGLTTVIKVTKKGQSILFVDSLNWFKESLANLGERIGIPKQKIDFDTCTLGELSTYCKQDVKILIGIFHELVRFLEINKISRLCYTLASTAMAAYLFRHYKTDIWIHNNAQAIDLERESYKGGRTECFYIGDLKSGPYYCLDVNSLYPFVMQTFDYPVRYRRILHNISILELARLLKKYSMVARVFLNTDCPIYAVKHDRTLFPIGRFSVVLTTPELIIALSNNHIEKISDVVIYDRADIFKSYVRRFYSLRQKYKKSDTDLFDHFCKLLLNSLYGKFGQRAEQWQKIGLCPGHADGTEDCIDAVTHRHKQIRYLFGEVFELTGWTESLHSFPAIAAHVTAYARLYLWHLMEIAGQGNYYYCDTDSLFVNAEGLENLKDFIGDTELGKLKLEYKTNRLEIFGLKDYQTDTKTVIKGIRKSAVKIEGEKYRQEFWPSLVGILRSDNVNTYYTKSITKQLTRNYTKGTVELDGRTRPFVFDESV